jgi:uncharacterized protein YegJ (DUF2314 family)
MRKIEGIFLALLMALAGGSVARAQEPDRIVNVAADDPEMNAAKARAIATLPDFYQHLARPAADESRFMVKFDILPGDEAEFVWATDLRRSGGTMTGELINQPAFTEDQLGDRVAIAEADIIDWAYFRSSVMQGSFTNRVLIDRMPPDEAAEYRRALGW